MHELTNATALTAALALAAMLAAATAAPAGEGEKPKKVPVILDTDIGDDIDDTWALIMLLNSPELDVKLVVGDHGKPQYRAKLIARLLTVAGRTDIPVGVGIGKGSGGKQAKWVADYELSDYAGKVHADGVGAIIDTIMKAPEPITLIAIGPMGNIEAALKREPKIAAKARFVGMHGSVRKGYGGRDKPSPEWNVRANVSACQAVFAADWMQATITPLDTCGIVHLDGKKYAAVRDADTPLTEALMTNYRLWLKDPKRADSRSSTLFDTVAVYLAFDTDLVKLETLPLRVTDKGHTVIDAENGHKLRVATEWKDLEKFEDLLVERITAR